MKCPLTNFYLTFINTDHALEEKYTGTAKAGGLSGLRSAKKDVKNLHEWKKALTKIITIQLNQERKDLSEKKNLQLKYNTWQLISNI